MRSELCRAVGESEWIDIAGGADGAAYLVCRFSSPEDVRAAAIQLQALRGMWALDQAVASRALRLTASARPRGGKGRDRAARKSVRRCSFRCWARSGGSRSLRGCSRRGE
jgi:hypothetical protein